MVEQKVHRELQDQNAMLKKELDSLKNPSGYSQDHKFKDYLYSPSTNATREVPSYSRQQPPMSA
jgi:hypothetical protein